MAMFIAILICYVNSIMPKIFATTHKGALAEILCLTNVLDLQVTGACFAPEAATSALWSRSYYPIKLGIPA
jgi:hypothetical protein